MRRRGPTMVRYQVHAWDLSGAYSIWTTAGFFNGSVFAQGGEDSQRSVDIRCLTGRPSLIKQVMIRRRAREKCVGSEAPAGPRTPVLLSASGHRTYGCNRLIILAEMGD